MKKITLGLVLFVVVASFAFPPVAQAGAKSAAAHLYLLEKDPADWTIVAGGAWGKMRYRPVAPAFDFVFNAHGLAAGESYTLLYYPDPWPGTGLICLGAATADDWGNAHIMGKVDTGDLPAMSDENYPAGAKIWLVTSADVDCEAAMMVGWNPTEYLFEKNLITFDAETR